MSYSIVYLERVQHHLKDAYDYYENVRIGLGDEFLEQVQNSIDHIGEYPLHFQIVLDESRKCNISKFPFGIFYYVNRNTITVTSVLHLHSDPQKWGLNK